MAFRPTPSNPTNAPKPAAGDAPAPPPDLDHHLTTFWEEYRNLILWCCTIILLAIVAKEGWGYYEARREAGIEAEFAAATSPARQREFAAAHPDHSLAGVAELRLGDAAYAANQALEAVNCYTQAIAILREGPVADRARLGLAMAEVQAGRAADGEADLRRLAEDAKGYLSVRSEAIYHLASLAAAAGRTADLQRLSSELLQADPNGRWTERVFALQARQPAPAAGVGAPAISVKP